MHFKKIFTVIFIILINNYFIYSSEFNKTIINLDSCIAEVSNLKISANVTNNNNIYFVFSLEQCIGCNKTKINIALKEIAKIFPSDSINIVVESKNEKDSYYLKSEFPEYKIIEDNNLFLTNKIMKNFIIIREKDNKSKLYYIFDSFDEFNTLITKDFISKSIPINENEHYISSPNILSYSDHSLKLFDTKNQFIYDISYFQNKTNFFKIPFKLHDFCTVDNILLQQAQKEGLNTNIVANCVIPITNKPNSYFIFFNQVLNKMYKDSNGIDNIQFTPILAEYNDTMLIKYNILPLDNYYKFLFKNSKLFGIYSVLPNYNLIDSMSFISEYSFEFNTFTKSLLSLKKDNPKSEYMFTFSDIICYDFYDENEFVFIKNIKKEIIMEYYLNQKLEEINLSSKFQIQENNIDVKIIEDKIYLSIFSPEHLRLLTINKENMSIIKEYKYLTPYESIITSNIIGVVDNELFLLNRYKKTRWYVETIKIN